MSVTYSVTATVRRANQFNIHEFRKLGLTSGSEANKEFSASVDLTQDVDPLPTFPILIQTPNITSIKFVVIQVTGGKASIRLSHNTQPFNNIDLPLEGTIIMSGVDLASILVLGVVEDYPFIEVFGLGS